jgi:hypothetical protein
MSIMNTKPRYFPTAVATKCGWINPITKELLVSVGNLLERIADEEIIVSLKQELSQPPVKKKEEIMQEQNIEEVKTRKPRKQKVLGETTEQKLQPGQQLLGEVVEYALDTPVLGE